MPVPSLGSINNEPDVGSNAQLIPDSNDLIGDAPANQIGTKLQDSSANDNQPAMVTQGANLFEQMSRLDMAPTPENWDSIVNYLQKAKLLDKFEASAMMGN